MMAGGAFGSGALGSIEPVQTSALMPGGSTILAELVRRLMATSTFAGDSAVDSDVVRAVRLALAAAGDSMLDADADSEAVTFVMMEGGSTLDVNARLVGEPLVVMSGTAALTVDNSKIIWIRASGGPPRVAILPLLEAPQPTIRIVPPPVPVPHLALKKRRREDV